MQVPLRRVLLEQAPVEIAHYPANPITEVQNQQPPAQVPPQQDFMAALTAFQEQLTRDNAALHAKSQQELLASQRESNAKLLQAQQSAAEEQRKARELQEQQNKQLLETQQQLEFSRQATAKETAKAAKLQADAAKLQADTLARQEAWEAEVSALKAP